MSNKKKPQLTVEYIGDGVFRGIDLTDYGGILKPTERINKLKQGTHLVYSNGEIKPAADGK